MIKPAISTTPTPPCFCQAIIAWQRVIAPQSVNVSDLNQVWHAFHKNVGYALCITCKNGMQCIEGWQQTTAMPEGYTPNDGPYRNDHIGWFVVQDVEIAGGMATAADHKTKIATVQNEQADPFKPNRRAKTPSLTAQAVGNQGARNFVSVIRPSRFGPILDYERRNA